jgi:hypothetical protein
MHSKNQWVSGLSPSPGILNITKKHNFSETESIQSPGQGREIPTLLVPLVV